MVMKHWWTLARNAEIHLFNLLLWLKLTLSDLMKGLVLLRAYFIMDSWPSQDSSRGSMKCYCKILNLTLVVVFSWFLYESHSNFINFIEPLEFGFTPATLEHIIWFRHSNWIVFQRNIANIFISAQVHCLIWCWRMCVGLAISSWKQVVGPGKGNRL